MKMKMKRMFVASLLMVLVAFTNKVQAQTKTKNEFSIAQCIEYANKNNLQVKNALLAIKSQEAINKEVTASAFPTLSANIGSMDYLKLPVSLLPGEIFGQPAGSYIPVKFGTKYNANASLQLQQLLFDGQVFVALQARRTTIAMQQKTAEVTEEMIKTNIHKIYYQLVVSKTQIGLLDANIERLQKLEHDSKELYKNGFVEKLDLDKIAVQIANLQTEKLKAVNGIELGYIGLKSLMGMPVADTLILTDKISEDQIKTDIANNQDYQYTDRKEFQAVSLGKKLNEYNIKRYQLSYLPTVSMSGAYTKNAQRNQFTFFKGGDWFTTSFIGINISTPIFDGFARKARITKAKIDLQQTENQLQNLRLTIDAEVTQAKMNFATAINTLDYQKKNMQLAESVYAQTKKKYEIGTGSNMEITGAQTDLVTAQTNYIAALYGAIIARVDYLKATGKL
ncbi:MAG: TolC family protein [Bacteroidetes bacterium]|nr:TolC family protein [Bacteroidota bacterium]